MLTWRHTALQARLVLKQEQRHSKERGTCFACKLQKEAARTTPVTTPKMSSAIAPRLRHAHVRRMSCGSIRLAGACTAGVGRMNVQVSRADALWSVAWCRAHSSKARITCCSRTLPSTEDRNGWHVRLTPGTRGYRASTHAMPPAPDLNVELGCL